MRTGCWGDRGNCRIQTLESMGIESGERPAGGEKGIREQRFALVAWKPGIPVYGVILNPACLRVYRARYRRYSSCKNTNAFVCKEFFRPLFHLHQLHDGTACRSQALILRSAARGLRSVHHIMVLAGNSLVS